MAGCLGNLLLVVGLSGLTRFVDPVTLSSLSEDLNVSAFHTFIESKEIKNYWYWNWVLIFLFSVKCKIFSLSLFSYLFNSQNHKKKNSYQKKKYIYLDKEQPK